MIGVIVKGMNMPQSCADCPAEIYERDENDLPCTICQQTGKEIDGIDTTKKRADFCPLTEISLNKEQMEIVNKMLKERG